MQQVCEQTPAQNEVTRHYSVVQPMYRTYINQAFLWHYVVCLISLFKAQ